MTRSVYFSKIRLAWCLLAVAIVVLLAVVAIVGSRGTGKQVAGIVVACVLVGLLLRWAACAVISDDDGLTVRNPLRTYRIPYSQIARIHQAAYTAGPGVAGAGGVVAIELKDGRTVRASALITYVRSPRAGARRYSDRVIDELLERTQQASPGILDEPAGLP